MIDPFLGDYEFAQYWWEHQTIGFKIRWLGGLWLWWILMVGLVMAELPT